MEEQDNVKAFNSYGESQMKVTTFSYTWIIKNYKHCYRRIGQSMTSPTFITHENEEYKWELRLYPSGFDDTCKDYVSLELVLVSGPSDVQDACIEFSAIDDEDVKQVKNSVIVTIAANLDQYKVYHFETQQEIRRNYLRNKNMTIKCDMYFNYGATEYTGSNYIQTVHDLTSPYHRLQEFNDFESILKDGQFSDATIVVGYKKFEVHKAILTARSCVFAAMFAHDMKEKNANTIEIAGDISAEVMQEVLRFIYAGKVNDLQSLAFDLLYAAEKYMLEGLKIMCEKVLMNKMSVENIGEILVLVDRNQTYKLRRAALDFVKVNARQLIRKEQFSAAMKTLSRAFLYVLIETIAD